MKIRPIFKDIFLTFVTQFVVFVGFILLYRIIANNYGNDGVSEYSFIRRLIGFMQSFLLIGLGIGMPKFIAAAKTLEQRVIYLKAAAMLLIVITFLFLVIINIFKTFFTEILFGNEHYTIFIFPLSLLLAGTVFHLFVYSYFRGRLLFVKFNFLQIINLAVVPLFIFWIFSFMALSEVLNMMGLITFIVALIFFLPYIKELFISTDRKKIISSSCDIITYGAPRMFSELMLNGLFVFGAIFSAHLLSIRQAGYFSLSISLLNVAVSFITPLGLVLLPKFSHLISNNTIEATKDKLEYLISAVLQLSIFICLQMIVFTDIIINLWLGPGFFDAIIITRIVFVSLAFYPFCTILSSVLYAYETKNFDLINISKSLFLFLVLSTGLFIFRNYVDIAVGISSIFSISIIYWSILTNYTIKKIYSINNKSIKYLFIALLINVIFVVIELFLKRIVVMNIYYLIVFEMVFGFMYLAILWLLKIEWIRYIPKIIFRGGR